MSLLADYYRIFNSGDRDAFLDLLTEDVVHDLNQGGSEVGKDAFGRFIQRMDRCYRETIQDLVVFESADESRGAAEFTVHGTYLSTDDGLPEAFNQTYQLPAGTFFTFRGGKVARVTMYYNLQEWLRQISLSS